MNALKNIMVAFRSGLIACVALLVTDRSWAADVESLRLKVPVYREIRTHIHRPADLKPGEKRPGVLLIGEPGCKLAAKLATTQRLVATHFSPTENIPKEFRSWEGGLGHAGQDAAAILLKHLLALPEVDKDNVVLVTFSFGVVGGTGALARHPDLAVKFLIDWEGPSGPQNLRWVPSDHKIVRNHPATDKAFWNERTASEFIKKVRCRYLRVQSEIDHVQVLGQNQHSIEMLSNAARGLCPWTRCNDNPPNIRYDAAHPERERRRWFPGKAPRDDMEKIVLRYVGEMTRMPPLPGCRVNAQVAVSWTHPCVKVFPDAAMPAEKSEAAPLYAARGETEAVQIVLRPKQAVSGLAATVSDFDGPAKLPASIATVRWVAYVPVKQASGPKGGTGLFPDPLPLRAPASIAAGQNQAAWITVRVPSSAKPGDYHARITFTAGGAKLCEVPLALHVWKFELPSTALEVMASARAGLRPQNDGGSPEEVYHRYIRNMTDHGVNTLGAHVLRPDQGWKQHDDEVAFLKSAGIRNFIMDLGWVKHERHRWPADAQWEMRNVFAAMGTLARESPRALRIADATGNDFDPKFRETLVGFVRQFTRHYEELGILDRSFVRFIDEPLLEDQRTVDWIARVSKLIKDTAPSLRILHTRAPIPALMPLTDIWEVHTDLWGPPYGEHIEAARQAGAEIWAYQNSIPLIDYSLMRVRAFAWALWKHRVTGTGAWWDLTAWAMTGQNPWEDTLYGPWNGGGVLLYPPRDKDEQGPIDSIRWEVWRDSLEDYRLLELAASLSKKHPDNVELKQLLAEADTVCPAWPGVRDVTTEPYWTDPMKLESLRHKLAEAVLKAID